MHDLQLGLSCVQAPNFNSLSGVSLAAAFMSLAYSTIAFAGSINSGRQPGMLSHASYHIAAVLFCLLWRLPLGASPLHLCVNCLLDLHLERVMRHASLV